MTGLTPSKTLMFVNIKPGNHRRLCLYVLYFLNHIGTPATRYENPKNKHGAAGRPFVAACISDVTRERR